MFNTKLVDLLKAAPVKTLSLTNIHRSNPNLYNELKDNGERVLIDMVSNGILEKVTLGTYKLVE